MSYCNYIAHTATHYASFNFYKKKNVTNIFYLKNPSIFTLAYSRVYTFTALNYNRKRSCHRTQQDFVA